MALRLKGQETVASLISSTGVETSVGDVKSLDIQFDRDTLSEGYLGQTTEQKDDIFKGVSGKIEIHIQDASILDVLRRINERSRRRLPGELFQIVTTVSFPTGEARRIIVPDVFFGAIPISAPSRDDYVMVTLDFVAEDARIMAV